ncbi:MAG: hypothetical protein JWO06_2219, partial [Bacteroidota bacterium]|nr:hypothetical protein [Bacteroidota bacterium]
QIEATQRLMAELQKNQMSQEQLDEITRLSSHIVTDSARRAYYNVFAGNMNFLDDVEKSLQGFTEKLTMDTAGNVTGNDPIDISTLRRLIDKKWKIADDPDVTTDGISSVVLINRVPTTMILLYTTGPDLKVAVLDPHESRNVSIHDGHFWIRAFFGKGWSASNKVYIPKAFGKIKKEHGTLVNDGWFTYRLKPGTRRTDYISLVTAKAINTNTDSVIFNLNSRTGRPFEIKGENLRGVTD